MAQLTPDISYKQLKRVSDWQLTEEAQRRALAELVGAISRLDATLHWGEGRTSASDGQRFAMPRKVLQQTFSTRFSDSALGGYRRGRHRRNPAPARQPDRMGQRHSLRTVRPRSRPGPLRNGSLCCISTRMWALPLWRERILLAEEYSARGQEVVIEFLAVVLGSFLPAWRRVMLGFGANLYFKGGVGCEEST